MHRSQLGFKVGPDRDWRAAQLRQTYNRTYVGHPRPTHPTGPANSISSRGFKSLLSDETRVPLRLPAPIIGIGDDCAVVVRDGVRWFAHIRRDGRWRPLQVRPNRLVRPWLEGGREQPERHRGHGRHAGVRPGNALGVTSDVSTAQIEAVYRGMAAATNEFGGEIVGGDTVRSAVLFISVALIGSANLRETGEPALLRRDAARVGDLVAVTGTVGGSAGGLQALAEGRNSPSRGIPQDHPFQAASQGCRRAGRWSTTASNVAST